MSKHTKEPKTHDPAPPVPSEPAPPDPTVREELVVATSEPQAQPQAEPKAEASPEEGLEKEISLLRGENLRLKAEVDELNEKYLRKLADEVNFRKRMLREKEDAQKYGVASLLTDLISILDDFDRGISSAEATKNYDQVHEGILLIRKQLSQMLENKYSLKRFESKGTPFDPNRHEALFAEPGDVEEAVVMEEYLPGYALHDRILRSAKVRVKIPGPKAETAAGQS